MSITWGVLALSPEPGSQDKECLTIIHIEYEFGNGEGPFLVHKGEAHTLGCHSLATKG